MGLDFWRKAISFSLEFPPTLLSIFLSGLYMIGVGWLLWSRRADFAQFNRVKRACLLLSFILVFPAYGLLILHRQQVGVLPTSPVGVLPLTPALSLAGSALVLAVAIWLGPGPGLVVNLLAGLAWARFYPLTLTDMLAFSAWGGTVGFCIYQPYKGELFDLLRRPLIAVPLSTVAPLLFFSLSRLVVNLPSGGLQAVDYLVTIWSNELPLWVVGGIILGALFQVLFLFPGLRPQLKNDRISAYSRSLRARLMIITMPLIVLSTVMSVLAVTSRAILLARTQSLEEMERSASNASEGIANFYYTGRNLLGTFAEDPALLDPLKRQHTLEVDRQVVPFFQELLLVDLTPKIMEVAPASRENIRLSPEELLLVKQGSELGISQITHLTELSPGEYILSLVQPVFGEDSGVPQALLLGRIQLDVNPMMRRVIDSLQKTRGIGAGFILDERGSIIAHHDPQRVLRPWAATTAASEYPVSQGLAYDDINPESGERVLTYILEVTGTPYRVVLQLPYSAVLETATAIAGPLLVVQLLAGLILLFALPFFTGRIIQPLNTLAEAANRIAHGNLRIPVDISGEDEVAQVGQAFEQMRLGLRARLNDLSLLLNIAQRAAATLDLEQGVQPILEGALAETGATVARFTLLRSGDQPQRVFTFGKQATSFDELDRAFTQVAMRRREALIINDLTQTQSTAAAAHDLGSVAIFPVHIQDTTVAVFWVGADESDGFDNAKGNFLSTLASQASFLVQNAQLFQTAEGERHRLAAILAGASDAILVTDAKAHILLTNPAAQALWGLDEDAHGRSVRELAIPEALSEALITTDDTQQPPNVEVPFADGRTFFASIAPIVSAEGNAFGKVVVMRDVTHFKELDEMKSEFVATVSHDLRAPLTFIRGYATMLMMVGELNEKQQEYLERILVGIDQMGALIGDLLNLRRIEAGVGIRQEPCRLGLILVEAVDTMRARGATKGTTLRLEPTEGAPTVIGDRTLLRQAVSNLIDNAVKYTPSGGQVSVGLTVNDKEVIIHIADTGIGIAPEDQVRLFEKFYRIKRRETGNIQGTGLGLALVKSIVERHKGRVWAESEVDKGSTFYIALPLPTEEQAQQVVAQTPAI